MWLDPRISCPVAFGGFVSVLKFRFGLVLELLYTCLWVTLSPVKGTAPLDSGMFPHTHGIRTGCAQVRASGDSFPLKEGSQAPRAECCMGQSSGTERLEMRRCLYRVYTYSNTYIRISCMKQTGNLDPTPVRAIELIVKNSLLAAGNLKISFDIEIYSQNSQLLYPSLLTILSLLGFKFFC